MIRVIKIDGFEEKIKLSFEDEKRSLNRVRNLFFGELINGERDKIMMGLIGKFKRLRFEDIEEAYGDGCMVLWEKLNSGTVEIEKTTLTSYLFKICNNICMHYLRKVRDDVESLDELMSVGYEKGDDECGLVRMFDIIDDDRYEEDERFRRLEVVWENLNVVDKMILESYYWDGCKMDEIARKIGYKNGDGVKSRKKKVLKRMLENMKSEEGSLELPSSFNVRILLLEDDNWHMCVFFATPLLFVRYVDVQRYENLYYVPNN